ncbi:hypothetical protein E2C01_058909 [Portunus trituberculatus]|uniref:Uncharacterized protein n=1 Tax=Portunus trituberculatus TaxID=210409 RepID=A0A5B7H6X6_PORTR|nr:hypothetical protein [Portunus trituberculatus]
MVAAQGLAQYADNEAEEAFRKYEGALSLRKERQNDKISTLLTGETLLKTPLIISAALENSGGENKYLNMDLNSKRRYCKYFMENRF